MRLLNIIAEAWFFYSRNLGVIALLCLPLLLLESSARLLMAELGTGSNPLVPDLLVSLVFYPVYTCALILYMDARTRNQSCRPVELLGRSVHYWLPLGILSGCSALLISLGLSLMILPGIWVIARLLFAEYLLVLEGLSPWEAMKASFRLTEGRLFWDAVALVVVVLMPLWGVGMWLVAQAAQWGEIGIVLLADGLAGLLELFASLVFFRLYILSRKVMA